jgi:peptidoglycan/LPS O-acetylase OafA/YrhL
VPAVRLTHIRALDGLRGVAIALVLALHSGYGSHFLGGGLGVDMFFVLSGFLITSLLVDEFEKTGDVSLRSFYARRVLRLYPALLLMVVAAAVLHTQLPGHNWGTFFEAAAAILFYVANLVMAFTNGHAIDGLGHTWTLAMEEQFYIVWPFILLFFLRRNRRTWLPALAGLGIIVALVSLHHNGPSRGGIPEAYFRPEARDIGLLIGCVTAFAVRDPRGHRIASVNAVPWVGVVVLAFAVVSSGRWSVQYLTESVPIACVGAALLIGGIAAQPHGIVARAFSWAPLCWLGLISYGVYVYSGLFNIVTDRAVATWAPWTVTLLRTGVAIAIAPVSYLLVEAPIRRRGRIWLARRGEVAVGGQAPA